MPKFYFSADVERNVIDSVTISVEAESLGEAQSKAIEVAETYPKAHYIEGVPHFYIENRKIIGSSVIDMERMVKTGD